MEHYITLLKTKIDDDEYRYRLIETLPQDDMNDKGFIDECRDIECLHSLLLAYAYKRSRNGDKNVELESACYWYTGYIFTRKEEVDDEDDSVKVNVSSPGAFAAVLKCDDLNCQKDHHNVRINHRRNNSESESDDGRFSDADWERQVQEELSDEEPSQPTQQNDMPCPDEFEPSPSRQQKQDSSLEGDTDTSEPTSSVAVPQLIDVYNSMQSGMEAHHSRLVSVRSNARTKMKDQIKYENDQVRMTYYQLQSGRSSNGGRTFEGCTASDWPKPIVTIRQTPGAKRPQMKYDPSVPMTKEQTSEWRRIERRKRNREAVAARCKRQRDRINPFPPMVSYFHFFGKPPTTTQRHHRATIISSSSLFNNSIS